jgi:hypothetical protein
MRTLTGYTNIAMHEFSGEDLSTVLSEVALYCATVEFKTPEFHLNQQYDAEEGKYIVFLYEQYSGGTENV